MDDLQGWPTAVDLCSNPAGSGEGLNTDCNVD